MAFRVYSEKAKLEVLETFCEESLFRSLYHILHDLRTDGYHFSEVEMWEDAKDFVLRLSETKYPTISIVQMIEQLNDHYHCYSGLDRDDVSGSVVKTHVMGNICYSDQRLIVKSVLLCAYAIIYATENERFTMCLDYLDESINWDEGLDGIEDNITQGLKNGQIIDDYDYFSNQPKVNEHASDQLRNECTRLEQENKQLNVRIAELEAQLNESGKLNLLRAVSMLKDAFPDAFNMAECSEQEKEKIVASLAYMLNANADTCRDYLKPSRHYDTDANNYKFHLRYLQQCGKKMGSVAEVRG